MANAAVLKTAVRKDLGVRIPRPPLEFPRPRIAASRARCPPARRTVSDQRVSRSSRLHSPAQRFEGGPRQGIPIVGVLTYQPHCVCGFEHQGRPLARPPPLVRAPDHARAVREADGADIRRCVVSAALVTGRVRVLRHPSQPIAGSANIRQRPDTARSRADALLGDAVARAGAGTASSVASLCHRLTTRGEAATAHDRS